ncbi:vacuolar protein sorting-associated protein 13C-like [Pecten maximus]|uniref:vacuolar protein sorting-associated protein 13C-like n=2 Tax=Pecten maximus TaxID=6579 RepID=UPI0014590ACA|nr:vacuolar protein sorting-associated protein 13C-like [Pecten maximus]
MSIDDMRPNNTRAVRNVFYCTREEVVTDDDHKPLPMISVIYKTAHDGSQEADIRMEKVTLNLNVPFLLRLQEFYAVSMGTTSDLLPPPLPGDLDTDGSHVDSPDLPAPVTPLKVFCTIKEPEIVLFADPSLEDSRIVVLKADIEVDMVNNEKTQKLVSKVKDLKMYSAQYSTQHAVSSWVIQPCDLTFERTYNILENHVDMSAHITELILCTSPSVLHFAFDVLALMGGKDSETPEDQATTSQTEDYRNLWGVKATSAEKWLNKIDNSGNSSMNPLIPQMSPSESLHLEIEQIHAYFQVRNLDHQVNLLHIRSSLDCKLHDWNKQFHMNAEMKLQVDYFNEKLSVWEPLVEPVSEKEGIYRPWEVVIKVIRGRSYPMTFNYVQEGFNMEECLRNDVQQLLHNSRRRSSSSESETDESTEMTVLRPKLPRKRSRIASDKSYESIKQGSIQGESDTEPDGLIHSITNKLGGIFSDDSSDDADVSETEDTDELHDPSLDKPVFLTPKGPVQVSMARRLCNAIKCQCPCLAKCRARSRYYKQVRQVESGLGFDQVDGRIEEEEEEEVGPQCNYVVIASQDKLQLNVTPQAIHVLTDVSQALTSPESLVFDCKDLPAFELHSKIGIHNTVTLHQDIKLYKDNVTGCTVKRAGDEVSDLQIIPRSSYNGVNAVDSSADGLLTRVLGSAGHVLTSAGAFVFDDDDDYLSGGEMDKDRLRLQVDGFDLTSTILHRRACLQLIPLTPDKHSIKYWFLLEIDVSHGRKVINILSPLKVKNSLTLDLDILCKTADLEKYLPERDVLGSKEYTKLATLAPDQDYNVPLFLAYHCDLFVCPTQLSRYQIHNKGIYWKDLLMTKEKAKCFTCQGSGEDRSFNLKVLCKEQTKLQPSQEIPKGVPYYVLHVKAPVMIHNYLPYDIQFSLEGTGNFSSLTHGESTPLYTVEQATPQKLHIQLQDYIGCDWTGIFEISQGLEEFKAVSMAPYDCAMDENSNKQLTIIVNAKEKLSLDLYFYSPYWVLNKTELPIQIRGSGSDAVYDCCPSNAVPLLFRFKKTKRKKAKVRVYNSKWSQSFSMDTIGNSGVVICYDKERQKRYRMMLQCQWSSLKLTRIVTILPFFLVVNNSSHNLRYMEENEETDLWEDLKKGKCCPLWPRTTSEKMFIKYEDSAVVSEHIPFNVLNNTVLRMEHGSALCVEVSGGIETPRTITFSDYDPGDAPVRVENLCDDVFITIHQINQHQMTVLPADRSILYTWDDPTGPRKLMWNVYGCSNKQDSEVDISKDGFYFKQLKIQLVQESGTYKYSPQQGRHHHDSSPEDDSDAVDYMYDSDIDNSTMLKTNSYKMKIFWISFLDGQQRVVLFTRDSRVADAARMMNEGEQASLLTMFSLDGLSLSVVSEAYEEVALVSVSSMPAMWQIEVKNKLKVLEDVTLVTWLEDKWIHGLSQASLEDRIEVDFANMRMTKPYIGDLCRVCPPGMLFQYRRSEHQTFIHAKVHHIQVDNQLHDAYYQTVLHPAPIPLNMIKKKGPKPFIEFGMIRRCVPENNVDTFRQLQVIIQEFSVQLDWGFIESIQDTFADLVPKQESECARLQSDLILAQKHLNDLAEVKDRSTKRIFFEMCKISPLKLHVSFSFRGTPHLTRDIQPNMTSDIKEFLRNSVGATFIEVKDVELKFGYFEKRGASLSWNQLTNQAVAHYRQQLILQVYVVVLGLDVLGNPYGLMQDISQGLGDLFYEPLLDTIQGDDEFSENMIRGFQSAMGHIVGGGANSVARITGSFGSALAYLSFDKEFQKKRRRRMQQQPADLPHSMAMAGKGFLTGIKFGLTGIVLDPYQGASEDGVEGFFKGIGRGILGLITQPIGGVLDMVSLAFDGVRRAAELEGGVVMRMRLPRCIDHYRGLKPYSDYRARGSHILKGLKGGKYSKTDVFRNFAPLSHEDKADLVFITNRHILYLEKSRFSGGYDVEWEVELKSILGVPAIIEDEKKLVIHLKDNTGSLFSDNNVEITSLEIDILKWIQKKLETVLNNQIYKV